MILHSHDLKLKKQNQLFLLRNNCSVVSRLKGVRCSEVIIMAMQNAYRLHTCKASKILMSLQLDPTACPPCTMMFAFPSDRENFQVLDELLMPNFTFSDEEKACFRNRVE